MTTGLTIGEQSLALGFKLYWGKLEVDELATQLCYSLGNQLLMLFLSLTFSFHTL